MRIGIIQDEISSERIAQYLKQLEIATDQKMIVEEVFDQEAMILLLEKDHADVTLQLLENLPMELPQNICIAALMDRYENNYVIQIHPSDYDEDQDLKLRKDACLNVLEPIVQEQISRLREDIIFDEDAPSKVERTDLITTKNKYQHINLHFSEVVPPTSSGLVCLLAHEDDYATRRLLKSVHQTPLVQASNVERTIKQNHPESHAFCFKDNRGNYQLHYAILENDKLRFGRESATTYLGLAEGVIQ